MLRGGKCGACTSSAPSSVSIQPLCFQGSGLHIQWGARWRLVRCDFGAACKESEEVHGGSDGSSSSVSQVQGGGLVGGCRPPAHQGAPRTPACVFRFAQAIAHAGGRSHGILSHVFRTCGARLDRIGLLRGFGRPPFGISFELICHAFSFPFSSSPITHARVVATSSRIRYRTAPVAAAGPRCCTSHHETLPHACFRGRLFQTLLPPPSPTCTLAAHATSSAVPSTSPWQFRDDT
mmetsp:Transcript_1892/g.11442  ORF Transcript_1892/g.11442 Transcript_1892/m.11442 type:complete len:235 (+) Transcript_1892:10675-11379(+)